MNTQLNDIGQHFVSERHMGILSTLDRRGGIHSVPVGFTLDGGILRIITSDATQKVVNVERGETATVAQVHEGRWISFSGPVSINRDAEAVAHAVELYAGRYRQPRVNPTRVVIEIAVDKTLGSADLFEPREESAA